MALRAALVSVVASMGLTFPGAGDLDRWVRAAQDWICTQFADWDARVSLEDSLLTTNSIGAPMPRADEVDEPRAQEPAPETGVEELILAFAGEITGDEAPQPPGLTKGGPLSGPAVADSVFGAVVEEMASRFAADRLEAADAPAHGPQVATAGGADGNGLEVEPLEIDGAAEPGVQLALALNRAAEGSSDQPDAPSEAARRAPIPEPLEADGAIELEPGVELALAVNREADGSGPALEATAPSTRAAILPQPDAPTVSIVPTPGRQLADAVRLTREAAFAWIKLLHSPAVVMIPR